MNTELQSRSGTTSARDDVVARWVKPALVNFGSVQSLTAAGSGGGGESCDMRGDCNSFPRQ